MKTRNLIFFSAVIVGVMLAVRHKTLPTTSAVPNHTYISPTKTKGNGGAPPSLHNSPILPVPSVSHSTTETWVKARGFEILGIDGQPRIQMALTAEGCAMWMHSEGRRASLQAGVHSNGFPFLLVSDGGIRNFGLGRVDGTNASPILVFRNNDIVKMVFGLHMSDAGQPAFLVTYGNNGNKTDVIGLY